MSPSFPLTVLSYDTANPLKCSSAQINCSFHCIVRLHRNKFPSSLILCSDSVAFLCSIVQNAFKCISFSFTIVVYSTYYIYTEYCCTKHCVAMYCLKIKHTTQSLFSFNYNCQKIQNFAVWMSFHLKMDTVCTGQTTS